MGLPLEAPERAAAAEKQAQEDGGRRSDDYDGCDAQQQLAGLGHLCVHGLGNGDQVRLIVDRFDELVALVGDGVAGDKNDELAGLSFFQGCLV